MSRRIKHFLIGTFLSSILFISGRAQAATYTWVGPNDGAWNNTAHWSPKGIPGTTDTVVIPSKKKISVPLDVAVTNLTVGAGAEIKNGGKVKVSGKTSSSGLFTGVGTVDVPVGATADFTVDSSSELNTPTTVVFAPIINKGRITTKVASGCRVDFASIDNTGSTEIISDGTVTFKDIKNTKSLDVSASGVLTLAKIDNATGAALSISAAAATSPLIAASPVTKGKATRARTLAADPSVVLLESLTNRKGGKVKLFGSQRQFKGKAIANEGEMQLSGAQLVLSEDVNNSVGATLTLDSNATITPADTSAPKLKNAGKIIKPAGSDATLHVEWTSTGQVIVEEGTLRVRVPLTKGCKQTGGLTTLEGGVLAIEDATNPTVKGTFEVAGGVVDGIGTIEGNVLNSAGTLKPGHSPGSITINGNFTQTSGGVLNMEVGGTTPGTGYDQILVQGTAYLGGTLNLVRWGGYVPKDGDIYVLFTYYSKVGSFAKFVDLTPTYGLAYDTTLTPTDYEVTCYATAAADSTPPTVAITSPVDGTGIRTLTSATGKANDTSSGVKGITCLLYRYPSLSAAAGYWAGGSSWTTTATATNERPAAGTTAWTLSLPTLTPGRYWLRARGTDVAGNSADSGMVWFWVDPNAPSTLTITNPLNGSIQLLLLPFTGAVADATNGCGIASVQGQLRRQSDGLYWNGTSWGTTAVSFSTTVIGTLWTSATNLPVGTNLKSGKYTLTMTATDGAGNKKVTTSTFTVGSILSVLSSPGS